MNPPGTGFVYLSSNDKIAIMKKLTLFSVLFTLLLPAANAQDVLTGAWEKVNGNAAREVAVFQDGYYMHTVFTDKEFLSTRGGPYNYADDKMKAKIEFDTKDTATIGTLENTGFQVDVDGNAVWKGNKWKRIDNGTGDLSGNWRITGRMQNGQMAQIGSRGARKTLKILSGTRFQWAAINPDTKQFSGTGGGTYTFENGVYTENIEFFSRDNNRVGASLNFEGEVSGDEWKHSGKSSTGNPIAEIWTREKRVVVN